MRRILVGAMVALATIGTMPMVASAGGGGSSERELVDGLARALIGMSDSDPWFFDDGCIGGETSREPLNVIVPSTDPATTESSCTVHKGAPIVVSAAGLSCWQPSLHAARKECEEGWNDPAASLVSASVIVDGKAKRLHEVRSSGRLTFPSDATLDTPGLKTKYYAINDVVIVRNLKPGEHTIEVAFEYADGFAGATTFHITVC
jgi:hypothetical protein